MSLPLMSLINKKVLILTVDGRTLLGTLLSTDQLTNIVLTNTVERIIRTPDDDEPSAQVEHGLYLIRGDNVVVCGEVDEKIDADIDWSKVKGQVIRDTKNA
ncbi:Sm-like protein LSM1B [Penicillium cataractarum]|uniref:LSM2-LSM8 complex subunit LSM8 n=4 Tax=Penicillium TaxID=5073 RepID=A0A0F7VG29_PENBI|nr:Sm-like protein LSM1B [Penicillium cataractarum]XP_056765722.1 Sm-like protein LSM1B [Penicillium daleae]XP_057005074.1 Sm-like protein LSM1B [Penicillium subrubescens]CEO58960.1 Putative Small nuclear ribonucleoprotein Lsm8 [Penicillium brasilianum]KAJ5359086.1 Sm-like protein LSM1B [Penicillium cataractarum]KAJ5450187.1 Sm-like protein LSM1B [Penicillium daleae]KAJ5883594.1 Sm-like protein LSM1B [Penicillium subrubescens]OKO93344.1 U6 snRNA-associated Sm-like protein LSm8 [Penicillium s